MHRRITIGAVAVGGVAAGVGVAAAVGSLRWAHATSDAVARLESESRSRQPSLGTAFSPADVAGLPPPAARYFGFALPPGQPLVRRARLRWEGEFRSAPNAKWSPFTAEQVITVHPPGFVWSASIRMAPLLHVRVRDAYVAGRGDMLGRVAGLITVADQGGTPEMAAGALARYLGEAAWVPTALLPSAGVAWTAIDDSTARATLTDRGTSVTADFHFGATGQILSVSMIRYRDVDGRGVPTPFVGRYGADYRRVGGMMVPASGEVEWLLPEGAEQGPFAYWRGRLLRSEYEFGASRNADTPPRAWRILARSFKRAGSR
jgi:hypothetical protein